MEIKVKNNCTGCGLCIKACLYDAIEIVNKRAVINDNCILCGACVDACRFKSIEITVHDKKKTDFSDYQGIGVFIEVSDGKINDASLELMNKAVELSKELESHVSAFIAAADVDIYFQQLVDYGANRINYARFDDNKEIYEDVLKELLIDMIEKTKPEIFLAGATALGRSLMPAVACALETGLTADCTELSID
ncbi:MAG: 4Fe-4S binding protein, partial [Actinomycetota bacterium]|nr:4Fe-4S binding protein [Actinomycetota bacterium]